MDVLLTTKKLNENFADNHGRLLFTRLDVSLNFPLFTSEKSVIISIKHCVYKLTHNDKNLRILWNRKYQKHLKTWKSLMSSAQSSSQNQNFVNTRTKLMKNRNWTLPVVCYLIWKLELVSNILPCPMLFQILIIWKFLEL